MKHLEVSQKYSPARRIFNSLLGVSSRDETLHLMLDILHPVFSILHNFKHPHFNSLKTVKKSSKNAYLLIMEPLFDWIQSWSDLEENMLK